ncbi:hypothetical protein PMIN02_001473 [Paraphaeosphaeria minitans]|uniref:Uncharacterized protein n=1 Tax=Paraphaeosphaeria minitans TaxID=565426 RepID=A0A9P6G7J4_9PLEO|nr:hypothetical protein PMIN01_11416 [Paraphaeosphaeria minitans]
MLNQATKSFRKMHARRNPNNLTVGSTASYTQLSPSITSATLLSPNLASRRGLLGPSPPPSPSLPSLIPRHGKKQPSTSQARLVKRLLIGGCGVAVLIWLVLRQMYAHRQQEAAPYEQAGEWEMVGGNMLPEEPSAVIVQDPKGKSKWTVSIPATYEFPLKPQHYRDICGQSMELQAQLREEAQGKGGIARRMLGYYQKDQYYVDIGDAEAQGLLPQTKATGRPKGFVHDAAIANKESTYGQQVCDRTLTYVMETSDAGFGNTLMRLWMSYGLAMAENRTFFIDDTRWPYGKYSTFFLPPPAAGCLPPSPSHMTPCPHSARHLVVSGATVTSTFGHAFTEEYEDPTKQYVQRQHKIFALLRTGYEALFKLRPDDATYVLDRTHGLYDPIKADGGLSIGLHVRRGDKHPYEFQYREDYIPFARYMDTARDLYISRIENAPASKSKSRAARSEAGDSLLARHTSSKLVLASDDPTVYETGELGPNALRAQDRIILATKAALEAAQGKKNPWLDEITGWEGGFYRDVFFSLGQPSKDAQAPYDPGAVPESARSLRELVGRAYLMDLAVVGGADVVVCTVSSVGCRILGVMVGWERAFGKGEGKGDWVNVDGEFDWRGIVW